MKLRILSIVACVALHLSGAFSSGNVAGGVRDGGKPVTVTSDAKTMTLSNGIVSIVCDKASPAVPRINYTYDNGAGETTLPLLAGGKRGGEFYWELGGVGGGPFQCETVVNPAIGDSAHLKGEYAEIALLGPSPSSGVAEIHYSMLRGSPGFYITLILKHRKADQAMGLGEIRTNVYLSPTFTWQSVDQERSHQYNIGGQSAGVAGAPKECTRWTSGFAAGQIEDKYKWSAHVGEERAWGWSSVTNEPAGFKGHNVGVWNVLGSAEFYAGGPLKSDLMDAPMVNMFNSSHYQMGLDTKCDAGEEWTKSYGPYFFYCNNIAANVSNASKAAAALFADAQAQAAAERSAWPYKWFVNPAYIPASGRGTIKGRIEIEDRFNPNAAPADLWVGVARKPRSTDGVVDFQQWAKPYQFWVKTDANGNFVIPGVIADDDYTLFAFGPGAAGTFQSQSLGDAAPGMIDIPISPFSVKVTGGGTRDLGVVKWTPARVGPTVFEIGVPDRTAREFRHGDDYWRTDTSPDPAAPNPVWSGFLQYRFDFPAGPHYTVGKSRWATDWNFIQPVVPDAQGNYGGSMSTITFNLARAPRPDAKASLYLAIASDYMGPLVIRLNDTDIAGARGFVPHYSKSDTSIREEINGAFSDIRFTIPVTLLKKGPNTITFDMRRGGYFANHAMYDYIRSRTHRLCAACPGGGHRLPGQRLRARALARGSRRHQLQYSPWNRRQRRAFRSGLRRHRSGVRQRSDAHQLCRHCCIQQRHLHVCRAVRQYGWRQRGFPSQREGDSIRIRGNHCAARAASSGGCRRGSFRHAHLEALGRRQLLYHPTLNSGQRRRRRFDSPSSHNSRQWCSRNNLHRRQLHEQHDLRLRPLRVKRRRHECRLQRGGCHYQSASAVSHLMGT